MAYLLRQPLDRRVRCRLDGDVAERPGKLDGTSDRLGESAQDERATRCAQAGGNGLDGQEAGTADVVDGAAVDRDLERAAADGIHDRPCELSTRSRRQPPGEGEQQDVATQLGGNRQPPGALLNSFHRADVDYISQEASATDSADDDIAVVERCLDGDHAAFEIVVVRYQRVLFNVALRMLGEHADASDATQNAFVKAYEKLGTYDRHHRFFSWIYRILRNECLNVLRARRRRESLVPLDTAVAASSPLDVLQVAERKARVNAALLALSPDYREVIAARYFAGLSYQEMSAALEIPEKTVKSRLHTARQRLGQLLLT
jgi:RNA polymerase sigma-70 factor (ECF subfamily)